VTNRRPNLALVLVVLLAALPLCACAQGAGKAPAKPDAIGPGGNELLALVLKTQFKTEGYTLVDPQTRLGMEISRDPKEVEQSKKYVREGLQLGGYDATKLVDALYAANAKPTRLTLVSKREDGYVVDYEGRAEKYFEGDGGGWEKFRQDNPLAAGMTSVSLPVLDQTNGIVLVYIGTQYDWTAGSGEILAFRLEKGELRQIGAVRLWIS